MLMQPAVLLPQTHEPEEPAITERLLTVYVAEQVPDHAVWVRDGVRRDRLLTSVHTHTLRRDFVDAALGQPRLAPDNPFLVEEERRRLDPAGLVPEGATVGRDDVLISAVLVLPEGEAGRRPMAGMELVRDRSDRVPEGWEGARVAAVRRQGRNTRGRAAARGPQDHVEITLRAERDLAVGDLLLAGPTPLGVVARFVPDGAALADVVVSAAVGRRLGLQAGTGRQLRVGKAVEGGADVLESRATGPYSLITCWPLRGGRCPGQQVTERQVRWLRSRGLLANVTELVCLKSNDLRNRRRLRQLFAGAPPAEGWFVPAAPDSQFILRTWLLALGLDVRMTSAGDHVELALRPATTAELLTRSRGRIVRPETIDYRTYAPVEGGLFCEQVYGPEKSPGRRRRFGHIDLPEPVVPLLWRTGSPSVLEQLLGLPADDIEDVVRRKIPGPAGATGAAAIRALVERLPDDCLPPGLRGRASALVQDPLLVPPPDLRPIVLLDSGNFATSDLNDLYRRVLNHANRLRKLIELNTPEVIRDNERLKLQDAVDALQANCLLSRPVTQQAGHEPPRPLRDCLASVLARVRESTKRVDYSARARAVPDGSLPEDRVGVPRQVFDTLGLHPEYPVLVTNPADPAGTWLALLPEAHDGVVLELPPAAYRQLGFAAGAADADVLCQLHRPLGPEACAEARALLAGDPGEMFSVSSQTGWTDHEEDEAIIAGLREAVLAGRAVPLSSARGLMLAGTGVVDEGEEEGLADLFASWAPPPEVREVPGSRP
jgi:hypothetical protein